MTMNSSKPIATPAQQSYIRTRENPYFEGLLRGDDVQIDSSHSFDLPEYAGKLNISQMTSDIGDMRHKKPFSAISEKPMDLTSEDSISDIVVETFGQSSSGNWSNIAKANSFAFSGIRSDLSFDFDDANDSIKESIPRILDIAEEYHTSPVLVRPIIENSYSVHKTKQTLSQIPLPQSAASFYNGYSPQMEIVESCESINKLNSYLKARRDDVNAGVPGRFLHAVIGHNESDVGSIASTITYAFYLNETLENNQYCTVPVINMKRTDLNAHAELKWLLDSCQIDQSSLVFLDEIDLSYYDLFGSLKLVLLSSHQLPAKLEALKEAVVEVFNCRKGEFVYPWVQTVTVGQDCSCCTLVAEMFALTSPEILAGRGFSRLLLAGILLDAGNLTSPHSTSKDKYMATLLINGAGRFGCNGLYQILRYKMHDVSDLRIVDILRKDFKKWTRVGKPGSAGSRLIVSHIGMSSIGLSVEELLAREITATHEIKYFQQSEKLRLLMVVSGYYDPQKNFKREILISAESGELMKNLLIFFNSNASQLPLKVLNQPGLRDEMRAFEVDKVTSRKTIERLLEEFGGTSKG